MEDGRNDDHDTGQFSLLPCYSPEEVEKKRTREKSQRTLSNMRIKATH